MMWINLDTEEEPLRQVFNDCGEIEAVRIVRDSKTGLGKGFGFILFEVSVLNAWVLISFLIIYIGTRKKVHNVQILEYNFIFW